MTVSASRRRILQAGAGTALAMPFVVRRGWAQDRSIQVGIYNGPQGEFFRKTVMPKFEAEKCYGISKAAKNDCQTANSSCAGTSKRDGQRDAWVYVPKGTCDRLVNGSLQPRA